MISGLTEYGTECEKRRIEKGLGTNKLCQMVSDKAGMFFDRSAYRKIVTGQVTKSKAFDALNVILEG